MDQTTVLVIASIVGLIISYFLIREAIVSALHKSMNELNKNIRVANRLKYLDLKKQGYTDQEIKTEIDKEN